MAAKAVTIGRSSANLGPGAAFLTNPLQVGSLAAQDPFDGFGLLKGFVNADQNLTVDVYQAWNQTDVLAVTPAVPAVGANNGRLLHQAILFVGAAAGDGLPFTAVLVAPWVTVRITNTAGGATTQLRFHAEAAE